MAGDWIKMRSNLDTDPDVVAMADILGIDEFSVVGRLHKFWSWADQHSSSGTLSRVTTRFIDRFVARDGFSDALAQVGWLVIRSDSLEIPSWDRHNGTTAKARAGEAVRKRLQRSPDQPDEMSGHLSGQTSGPEKRREESTDSLTHSQPARVGPQDEIPDLKTVLAYAATIGLAAWRAEDEFQKLEANGWIDGKGNRIRKWQPYFTRVRGWWEGDGRPMQRPVNARNGHSAPSTPGSQKNAPTVVPGAKKWAAQLVSSTPKHELEEAVQRNLERNRVQSQQTPAAA